MTRPVFIDNEAFRCLREGDLLKFGALIKNKDKLDLTGCDLRGTDFRQVEVSKLVLHNAYLRDADLRGVDLRNNDLQGVSIRNAKISGTFFPDTLSASEILMSHEYGTRMRMGH